MLNDLYNPCFELTSDSREPEDIFEEFLSHLFCCELLVVQDMLLEELCLTIHVRAIEDPVPVDLLFLEGVDFP